jgi:ABC-type Fe3+-siderophore transport system permease subunit
MTLSVAGAAYQGMFKNPLVSPDILGASAGAAFGACLALLMNLGNTFIQREEKVKEIFSSSNARVCIIRKIVYNGITVDGR